MINRIEEQIKIIVRNDLDVDIIDNLEALFGSRIALEPRDIVYVIYKFIKNNNIVLHTIPYWEYYDVNMQNLIRYCEKLLLINGG